MFPTLCNVVLSETTELTGQLLPVLVVLSLYSLAKTRELVSHKCPPAAMTLESGQKPGVRNKVEIRDMQAWGEPVWPSGRTLS